MPSSRSPSKVVTGSGRLPAGSAVSSAVSAAFLLDGDYGDLIVSDRGTALHIQNGVVVNAKLDSMPANTVKVRNSATEGAPNDLVIQSNTVLGRTGASIVADKVQRAQIANNAVDNARAAEMDGNTVKVNPESSPGSPVDLLIEPHTVLGRLGANVEATQVAASQIADLAVGNSKLSLVPEGSLKGRSWSAGAGAPTDLNRGEIAELVYESRRLSSSWFDDMWCVHSVTQSTAPWVTGDGAWNLVVDAGALTNVYGAAIAGKPGVAMFELPNTGDQGFSISKTLSGRNAFEFRSLKRFVCSLRCESSSGPWYLVGVANTLRPGSGAGSIAAYYRADGSSIRAHTKYETISHMSAPLGGGGSVFRHMSIERLADGTLQYELDDEVVHSVAPAVHQISPYAGVFVTLFMGKSNSTGGFQVDYAGCSFNERE